MRSAAPTFGEFEVSPADNDNIGEVLLHDVLYEVDLDANDDGTRLHGSGEIPGLVRHCEW